MIGRRAAIALLLPCGLASCAFAAPAAQAEPFTAAYTCVKVAKPTALSIGFKDEHCTEAVKGTEANWKHEYIPTNTVTEVKVTNNETMSKTVASKFKGKVAGTAFELEAGGFLSCKGAESWVGNIEIFGLNAIGGFCGEFYNVVVNSPENCTIPNKVVKLNGPGNIATYVTKFGEMFIEFTPPAGKPFASFEFSGEKCSLNGKKVNVTGTAKANVTTQESPLDGATLKFTTEETRFTVEIEEQIAELSATFTPRMVPESGVPEYPVVLTTNEPI